MAFSTRYIIIDDDEFNNKICTVTLEKMFKDAEVVTFLDPVKGFDHLVSEYSKPGNEHNAILFLDINMPVMNGWEFLDRFETLDPAIKEHIKIYILSSSVDKRDIERARLNKNVAQYIVKPLTKDVITQVTKARTQ
jgi:CheY-like chemotaxis protein